MTKEEFLKLCEPIAELVGAKHDDYNATTVRLEDYFPFGDKSYVHMLFTKVLRMVSLAHNPKQPRFESVQDSVYDLIAYAIFYTKYLNVQTKRIHDAKMALLYPQVKEVVDGINKEGEAK